MSIPIYLITAFEKLEVYDEFMADLGETRAVAFYYDFDEAESVVIENFCDIWETCYDYAVIEKVTEGMYPHCKNRWFYKYNESSEKYERIDEPKCVEHLTNFSIG